MLNTILQRKIPTIVSIPPPCRLHFSRTLKKALDNVLAHPSDVTAWLQLLLLTVCTLHLYVPKSSREARSSNRKKLQISAINQALTRWKEPNGCFIMTQELLGLFHPIPRKEHSNMKKQDSTLLACRKKLSYGHYSDAICSLPSDGVAPSTPDTLHELRQKYPPASPPYIPVEEISTPALAIDVKVVLAALRSFPKGTSCGRNGLRDQHLLDALSVNVAAFAEDLLQSIAGVVNLWLAGIPCGGEGILHSANRLLDMKGSDNTKTMLLIDFSNPFNLVDRSTMINEVRKHCPSISRWVEFCYSTPARLYYNDSVLSSSQGVQQGDPLGPILFALALHPLAEKIASHCTLDFHAWYLDDDTLAGDTLEVSKALRIIQDEGPCRGLYLNVMKTEIFWPAGVFPAHIGKPAGGVKLLGGLVSLDMQYYSDLVMSTIDKTL
ncbi:uncharacterized protein LOC113357496 [Papaver somniferum]|uniref:uncharacterized protein LOC113357496 n=1 Tax=Papaver somniferum TaxID=3469 RepID=UPI000E6FB424|nr:uncharacterized protein LOC113357496 [Papaver somniferum]XP_026456691.1 uncharacterized protein LOC113357496 [Papaver somniferum]